MKVVILCGGEGTRLREETEFIPKPLVKVGGMPILWHIMKHYAGHGFNDFVLCLGYKGEMIKDFFLNYELMENDFTLNLRSKDEKIVHHNANLEDWNITFANTGLKTETGGRIKKVENYIDGDTFLATYGDGVSDIDIKALVNYHLQKKKVATLTALHPVSKFGTLKMDTEGLVTYFREKPAMRDWISGGFFVFQRKVFDYLTDSDDCCLERGPFEALAKARQIAVYKHEGFWKCMDTYKDMKVLNDLWEKQKPWKTWK
ncbi:MAG: glucose-1-phosphate cytidylyltransferase [Nanoarchaeota archaeon]